MVVLIRCAFALTAILLTGYAAGCGRGGTEAAPATTEDQVHAQKERRPGDHRPNTNELDLDPRLPDKTTTYFDPEHRLRVRYPANWERARQTLTPRLKHDGGIAVGTVSFPPQSGQACSARPDLPQVEVGANDALVHMQIQPIKGAVAQKESPRFQLLEQVRPVEPDRPASGQVFPWGCLNRVGIAGVRTFFGFEGGVAYVTAVVGEDAPDSTRREALGVLESLRFEGS